MPKWPKIEFNEIKKRSRVLVIDDGVFQYMELFKNDGYVVEKWDDVEDLGKLESGDYDIILLDIQGVGRKQSVDQGLGVLKHLRKTAPAQIIIAFSNADWSLKYQDFFNMADHVLAKGSDYVDFKRIVDEYLKKRFSLEYYITKIDKTVNAELGPSVELKTLVKKAILKNKINKLQIFLEDRLNDPDTIKKVLSYVNVAIGLFNTIKTFIPQSY